MAKRKKMPAMPAMAKGEKVGGKMPAMAKGKKAGGKMPAMPVMPKGKKKKGMSDLAMLKSRKL